MRWGDPDLAVLWAIAEAVVSDADAANPALREQAGPRPVAGSPEG